MATKKKNVALQISGYIVCSIWHSLISLIFFFSLSLLYTDLSVANPFGPDEFICLLHVCEYAYNLSKRHAVRSVCTFSFVGFSVNRAHFSHCNANKDFILLQIQRKRWKTLAEPMYVYRMHSIWCESQVLDACDSIQWNSLSFLFIFIIYAFEVVKRIWINAPETNGK